jgi:hypothetical protein
MGKSRSVTVMIAYLLRQHPELTVSSALELIRQSRPIAEPNDGFMAQLELYKEMGCPRDIDAQPKYQRWLYQKEVDLALAAGMAPDRVRFEDEEMQEESENGGKEVELRCRKCRYGFCFHSCLPVFMSLVWPFLAQQPHSTGTCIKANSLIYQAHTCHNTLPRHPSPYTVQDHDPFTNRTHILTAIQSPTDTSPQRLHTPLPSPSLLDATRTRARNLDWPT